MLRAALVLLALLALGFALRDVDPAATWALLQALGPLAALILIPYGVAVSFDALGWGVLLRSVGGHAPFLGRVRVRLMSDAVLLTIVGGPVFAEGVVPLVLFERYGTPVPSTVASLALRRRFVFAGNGLYLFIGLMVATPVLQTVSRTVLGFDGLEWLLGSFAVVLLVLGIGLGWILARGRVAARLHRALGWFPSARLGAWLAQNEARFLETDQQFGLRLAPATTLRALPFFTLAWLVEAAETFTILHLLGASLGVRECLVMEMSMSLLRSLVFVVPAGLGVQDLGYTAFLRALGLPGATELAAAFVVLKRGKELIWVVVGYVLLAVRRARPSGLRQPIEGG